MNRWNFHIGDTVRITYHSTVSRYTPAWTDGWEGRILQLNQLTASVRLERGSPVLIDYDDLTIIKPSG